MPQNCFFSVPNDGGISPDSVLEDIDDGLRTMAKVMSMVLNDLTISVEDSNTMRTLFDIYLDFVETQRTRLMKLMQSQAAVADIAATANSQRAGDNPVVKTAKGVRSHA